jgi:LPS-assembly protein
MRVRPSEKLDLAWDFDYDTLQRKFTTSNVFADIHQGNLFGGFSYAGLHAPGRFETNGQPSSTTDFSQMRVLLGYGMPTKAGLSVRNENAYRFNFTLANIGTAGNLRRAERLF